MTGPAVGRGRLAARDLAELARLLDRAVIRVGRALFRSRRPGAGLRTRELEAACRLYLVSWSDGSAVAGFDLGESLPEMPALHHIGQDSLRHFMAGLSQISAAKSPEAPLPDGFDEGVLETCAALGKLLDHGIEMLNLTEPTRSQGPSVCYDLSMRQRIRALVNRERVLMGRAELDLSFPVHAVPAEPGAGGVAPPAESSFWKSTSLDQLVADQGVLPITDIGELDEVWSEGDVFDDALLEVLQDRKNRRRYGHVR